MESTITLRTKDGSVHVVVKIQSDKTLKDVFTAIGIATDRVLTDRSLDVTLSSIDASEVIQYEVTTPKTIPFNPFNATGQSSRVFNPFATTESANPFGQTCNVANDDHKALLLPLLEAKRLNIKHDIKMLQIYGKECKAIQSEAFTYYCFECDMTVCSKCIAEKHQGHEISIRKGDHLVEECIEAKMDQKFSKLLQMDSIKTNLKQIIVHTARIAAVIWNVNIKDKEKAYKFFDNNAGNILIEKIFCYLAFMNIRSTVDDIHNAIVRDKLQNIDTTGSHILQQLSVGDKSIYTNRYFDCSQDISYLLMMSANTLFEKNQEVDTSQLLEFVSCMTVVRGELFTKVITSGLIDNLLEQFRQTIGHVNADQSSLEAVTLITNVTAYNGSDRFIDVVVRDRPALLQAIFQTYMHVAQLGLVRVGAQDFEAMSQYVDDQMMYLGFVIRAVFGQKCSVRLAPGDAKGLLEAARSVFVEYMRAPRADYRESVNYCPDAPYLMLLRLLEAVVVGFDRGSFVGGVDAAAGGRLGETLDRSLIHNLLFMAQAEFGLRADYRGIYQAATQSELNRQVLRGCQLYAAGHLRERLLADAAFAAAIRSAAEGAAEPRPGADHLYRLLALSGCLGTGRPDRAGLLGLLACQGLGHRATVTALQGKLGHACFDGDLADAQFALGRYRDTARKRLPDRGGDFSRLVQIIAQNATDSEAFVALIDEQLKKLEQEEEIRGCRDHVYCKVTQAPAGKATFVQYQVVDSIDGTKVVLQDLLGSISYYIKNVTNCGLTFLNTHAKTLQDVVEGYITLLGRFEHNCMLECTDERLNRAIEILRSYQSSYQLINDLVMKQICSGCNNSLQQSWDLLINVCLGCGLAWHDQCGAQCECGTQLYLQLDTMAIVSNIHGVECVHQAPYRNKYTHQPGDIEGDIQYFSVQGVNEFLLEALSCIDRRSRMTKKQVVMLEFGEDYNSFLSEDCSQITAGPDWKDYIMIKKSEYSGSYSGGEESGEDEHDGGEVDSNTDDKSQ